MKDCPILVYKKTTGVEENTDDFINRILDIMQYNDEQKETILYRLSFNPHKERIIELLRLFFNEFENGVGLNITEDNSIRYHSISRELHKLGSPVIVYADFPCYPYEIYNRKCYPEQFWTIGKIVKEYCRFFDEIKVKHNGKYFKGDLYIMLTGLVSKGVLISFEVSDIFKSYRLSGEWESFPKPYIRGVNVTVNDIPKFDFNEFELF